MFYNVGTKIKNVSEILCWLGIIASVIIGFYLMTDEGTIVGGIFVIAFGSLISWLSSLFAYGFGQLIENTDILIIDKGYTPYPISNDSTPDEDVEEPEISEGPIDYTHMSEVSKTKLAKLDTLLENGDITMDEYLQLLKEI